MSSGKLRHIQGHKGYIVNLPKALLLTCTLVVIAACGGTPVKETSPIVKKETPVSQIIEQAPIDTIIADYRTTQNAQLTVDNLLDYAQMLQSEGNCSDSNLIVYHLLNTSLNSQQRAHSELLRSECSLKAILDNGKHSDTELALAKIDVWLSNASDLSIHDNKQKKRIQFALAVYQVLTESYKESIEALARADVTKNMSIANEAAAASILHPYRINLLWQALSQQTHEYRHSLLNEVPSLAPFVTLLAIVEDETLSDKSRQQSLKTWLDDNAELAQHEQMPQTITHFSSIQLSESSDILVLLPLSGRLQTQGNAIKQGILSAYYDRAKRLRELNLEETYTISFVDSGSDEQLSQEALSLDYSQHALLLGPLLKGHIRQLSNILPPNLARVHLNSKPQGAVDSFENADIQTTYFALSPEQEAEELARLMLSKGIKNPIVIFEDSNVSERMKNAFTQHWYSELSSNENPASTKLSEVSFTDNKSMRVGITSALDVLQSEKRIKQLSGLTTGVVHSVTRNRRDVDGFVVFAKPQDLELLNPIIESSISLFSDKAVPVFATSYSYNHKYNKNSVRDLRNLVFIDMPFVQPEARQSDLALTVEGLYNQPSSTFLRLFAFGYDALSIANNSLQLRLFEQVTQHGLSGELSVLKNGLVNRRLSALSIEDTQANSTN